VHILAFVGKNGQQYSLWRRITLSYFEINNHFMTSKGLVTREEMQKIKFSFNDLDTEPTGNNVYPLIQLKNQKTIR
jgi:hypothetical protein